MQLLAAISSMRGVGQGKYSTADLYQGRYKLEETTQMGGLNVVKLAIDMKTERKVALKFLNNKESFMRECSFLKALRSEYVATAHTHTRPYHSPLRVCPLTVACALF